MNKILIGLFQLFYYFILLNYLCIYKKNILVVLLEGTQHQHMSGSKKIMTVKINYYL